MTIWHMRIARSTPDARNPHLEYVILIAFLLQQWLHERTSLLRYVHYLYCCNGDCVLRGTD